MLRKLVPSYYQKLTHTQNFYKLNNRNFATEERLNAWEAPLKIAKWKYEHIVFAVLGGWAIVIYGGMKMWRGSGNTTTSSSSDNSKELTKEKVVDEKTT